MFTCCLKATMKILNNTMIRHNILFSTFVKMVLFRLKAQKFGGMIKYECVYVEMNEGTTTLWADSPQEGSGGMSRG